MSFETINIEEADSFHVLEGSINRIAMARRILLFPLAADNNPATALPSTTFLPA
ncbi:MAG: hypothetical protein ABIJ59_02290 [Pseudomonadota bacterium]